MANPRFVDLQLPGYNLADFFGSIVTADELHAAATRLREHDVRAALPMVSTDKIDNIAARLKNLVKLLDADPAMRRLFPAFHIEGPCLSPDSGYSGAHAPENMKPATREVLEPLIEAAGGFERVAIVTLAPEVDRDMKTTRWLKENGVMVSLGHTNASREQLRDAVAAGASLFTHLGNGCAKLIDRHDNIITRALDTDGLQFMFIADGEHVPFFVLKQWVKLVGSDRAIFVTDAVAPAGAPRGRYKFWGKEFDSTPGRALKFEGTPYLAGSTLTMPQAYRNAIEQLGLSEDDAWQVCCANPARLLKKWLVRLNAW